MPAYYRATLKEWINTPANSILGEIEHQASLQGFVTSFTSQTQAWVFQIELLKEAASTWLQTRPDRASWALLIEYPIPRRQRRIDVVLLAAGAIFCIEFKTDLHTKRKNQLQPKRDALLRGGMRQVEDYALDLRDFHSASRIAPIFPILALPHAENNDEVLEIQRPAHVATTVKLNQLGLVQYVEQVAQCLGDTEPVIDAEAWDNASYHPVPTIIEAAEVLYGDHDVREIAHSAAGPANLAATSERLLELVNRAKMNHEKIVCFVTGIPGAGKTLAGLNLAHSPELRAAGLPPSVFLTGNGTLVKVVAEALARDKTKAGGIANARRTVTTFIQNVHSYIRFALRSNGAQPEKVVVFDEAQRAWNVDQIVKKFSALRGRSFDVLDQQYDVFSEAQQMLLVMDRHPDWAVLVALIGGGQEINDGESGLEEWGLALQHSATNWKIAASPVILPGGDGIAGQHLFPAAIPETLEVMSELSLHLNVCIRSLRADSLSQWVDAILKGDGAHARDLIPTCADYPITLTRCLATARQWLRENCRGERRCGLLASAGALRLRAEGIEVTQSFRANKKQYENWFLSPIDDIRSSNQLEIAATQYECQGLEIDWAGLCWGEDLLRLPSDEWCYTINKGGSRNAVRDEDKKRYLLNCYRVLLTRARSGMVLFIPKTEIDDKTRPGALYDATANFLINCGVQSLD